MLCILCSRVNVKVSGLLQAFDELASILEEVTAFFLEKF
jgi:hypothetical protein